ncbi:MAG: hypothetical protein WC052_06090 [Patescibacteria group bacterium]
MYWYVEGKGLVSGNVEPDGRIFPLDEQTFAHCRDNYELLDIFVRDNQLHITIDMPAYRAAAQEKLVNVNYIVHSNVKYYDDELGYLSDTYITRSGYPCVLTQKQMIQRVTERNRLYAYKRSGINSARTPEEVDDYLCQIP